MELYCGMDLHANNILIVLLDDKDREILRRRVKNNLELVLRTLSSYRESIVGIAVARARY